MVRSLVLTLSHLFLYSMKSDYIPTQLPQKAASTCFVFVESILWLAFVGKLFIPHPQILMGSTLVLVAVERDLGVSAQA